MNRTQQLNRIIGNYPALATLDGPQRRAVRSVAEKFLEKVMAEDRQKRLLEQLAAFATVDHQAAQVSLPAGFELTEGHQALIRRAQKIGYTVQRSMF